MALPCCSGQAAPQEESRCAAHILKQAFSRWLRWCGWNRVHVAETENLAVILSTRLNALAVPIHYRMSKAAEWGGIPGEWLVFSPQKLEEGGFKIRNTGSGSHKAGELASKSEAGVREDPRVLLLHHPFSGLRAGLPTSFRPLGHTYPWANRMYTVFYRGLFAGQF